MSRLFRSTSYSTLTPTIFLDLRRRDQKHKSLLLLLQQCLAMLPSSRVVVWRFLTFFAITAVSLHIFKSSDSNSARQQTQPHRRSLRALQQQLDPAVQLKSVPKPSLYQVTTFRQCINDYVSGRSSSGSSTNANIVTEAGRSQLTVTLQQDGRYATLKNLNAQKRGEPLQPLAFAEPASTADVAALVKCSVAAGLQFTARNGGHHYEANSLLGNGVVLDMIKLQELTVNDKDGTAVLGAGQKLGSIYAALASNGYTIPAGTCVGVGISGLTLGGGLGHATRALGPMADSVLQATVVLPSGQVVTASPSSEPDLFWAIRGGGPLYGIVTSWTVKLHKAPPKASIVKYKFRQNCTEAKFSEVLKAWNDWKPWQLSKEHALVDIECGYGHLWVQVWYWGSLQDLMKTVKASPVYALEGAYDFHSKEYDWSDFIVRVKTNLHDSAEWSIKDLGISSVAQDQGSFVAGSLLALAPMSSAAISAMAKLIGGAEKHAFIQARAWGGAMIAVPEDFNAFPWRKPLYEFQVYSGGGGTATDRSFVDRTLATLQPLMASYGELYNYFHCVKDPWKTYFGPHADRLQQIKKEYDPDNRMGGLYCQRGVVEAA